MFTGLNRPKDGEREGEGEREKNEEVIQTRRTVSVSLTCLKQIK